MNQGQGKDDTMEAPYRQCLGCGYCCTKTTCTKALAKQAIHYMRSNKHGWAADFIG